MKQQNDILALLHHLLATPVENEVVEFKEAKDSYSFDKIGQYFSALANEAISEAILSPGLCLASPTSGKLLEHISAPSLKICTA